GRKGDLARGRLAKERPENFTASPPTENRKPKQPIMAKIFFHCGAHKTASSHLQHALKLNQAYLKSRGIKYIKLKYHKNLGRRMMRLRSCWDQKEYDTAKEINSIRKIINESLRGYDKAILSYEGVFGEMSHYKSKTIYPDAEKLIAIYKIILYVHKIIADFVILY